MTTTRTYRLRGGEVERAWHVLDADSRPLGRLATEAASLLLGKHKPSYEPHLAMGDFVVVVNASRVAVTGRKSLQKIYYRHSGYPGGLRERTLEQQLSRDPCTVVERAVRGMLPHNSRGRELFRRLKVYAGPEHPHQAQLAAGTGERARRRRRSEETASSSAVEAVPATVDVESPAPAVEAAPEATSEAAPEATPEAASGRRGSLGRWTRAQLDAEAARIGIEIESGWTKPDVIAAIRAHEAPEAATDEQDG